jgi:hypothetical protein
MHHPSRGPEPWRTDEEDDEWVDIYISPIQENPL